MSVVSSGPFCTALSCRSDAVVVIDRGAGERSVCRECATGQEVLGDV